MLIVLNKRWISQGWRAMDLKDSEPMAQVWIGELDRHGIPWRHYVELYERAVDARIKAQVDGGEVPKFNAELLAACWPALREDLHRREVEAGRTLTGHAESHCPKCFGTGTPYKFDIDGKPLGAMAGKRCDHNTDQDGLFEEEDPESAEKLDDALAAVRFAMAAQEKDETAAQMLSRLANDVWHEADDAERGSPEQRELGEVWLTMLRAARYARLHDKGEG